MFRATSLTQPAALARSVIALSIGLLLVASILLLPAHAQRGARTISVSLDQMTDEAEVIVHGVVTSTKVEPHPQLQNLMTVVVTLQVKDTYKGKARKTLTFRQYVWDLDPQRQAADYGKRQELVLFLRAPSGYGLTSPVGLEQGRFRISRDRRGREIALNGRGNVGLFQSVAARAQARGVRLSARTLKAAQSPDPSGLLLSDLEDAVRTLARAQ